MDTLGCHIHTRGKQTRSEDTRTLRGHTHAQRTHARSGDTDTLGRLVHARGIRTPTEKLKRLGHGHDRRHVHGLKL